MLEWDLNDNNKAVSTGKHSTQMVVVVVCVQCIILTLNLLGDGAQVPDEGLCVIASCAHVTRRVWCPRNSIHTTRVPLWLCHGRTWHSGVPHDGDGDDDDDEGESSIPHRQ